MKRTSLLAAAGIALVSVLALAACAGSPAPATAPTQAAATGQGQGAPGRLPGASGRVAAVTGSTAQVQAATTQTAVSWNSATTFTQQVAATPAALAVGECIIARAARGGAATATGSALAAVSIAIVTAVNGSCIGGFSFPGGGGFRTQNPARPSTAPSRPGGFAGGFAVVGTIASVGDGTMTVSPSRPAGAGTRTVTWSAATSITRTVPASASAVVVGICVSAQGKTDDTGALTASSIVVSAPVGGVCTGGLRGTGAGQPGSSNG